MGEVDKRVRDVHELPDESLLCAAMGRHTGFGEDASTEVREVDGWGHRQAVEVKYRCNCGRWKREVIDGDSGETLSRSPEYGGGVLLWLGSSPSRAEAKAEWLRRLWERRRLQRHQQLRESA